MPNKRNPAYLITGAASGMGAAAAVRLAEPGVQLALLDVNEQGLQLVAKQAADRGARVRTDVIDVANRSAVTTTVGSVADEFGRIDGAIHFAALLSRVPFEDIDEDVFDKVIRTNLGGSLWIAQALAAVMKSQGEGSIVLTASDSARQGSSVSGPAYAASKGGVISLTRNLAAILGPFGIRVNAICPGLALTGMSDGWESSVLERYVERVPLRRLGTADQMAAAAIGLMGDSMIHVTGEVLEVNGGAYFD